MARCGKSEAAMALVSCEVGLESGAGRAMLG